MFSRITFSDIKFMIPSDAKWVCNNPDVEIASVRDYSETSHAQKDCLYICPFERYIACESDSIANAIVFAPSHNIAQELSTKNNLIVVFKQEELYRITTKILSQLSIFARLGSASLNMQNLSIGRSPLESVMDYAEHELGNPIVLTDASFMMIAKRGTGQLKSEPQWAFAEKNGSFPPEFIGNYMAEESLSHISIIDEQNLIDDKSRLEMNNRQASVRIVFGGKTIGFLLVLESKRQFSEFDMQFIPMLASFVAQIIGHNDHKLLLNTSFNEDFLTSLLSEAITSPEEILQKQETFGIRLDETLRIITIDMPLATMDSDTTHNFIRRLRLFFNEDCIVPFENAIVILMDTNDDDFFLSDADFKGFEDLLNEFCCKANVSSPFHYLYQTRRHYMQTMMCSTIRSMLHIEKPILGYLKEMAEYHMIFNYSMVQNLDNLLHPAVIKLRKLDAENGTDMLDTLFAYADHLCNLTATAKALYLHYNTLKYRIDKIASITDVDFNNSSDVHRIALSKKVLEIEEAINKI